MAKYKVYPEGYCPATAEQDSPEGEKMRAMQPVETDQRPVGLWYSEEKSPEVLKQKEIYE